MILHNKKTAVAISVASMLSGLFGTGSLQANPPADEKKWMDSIIQIVRKDRAVQGGRVIRHLDENSGRFQLLEIHPFLPSGGPRSDATGSELRPLSDTEARFLLHSTASTVNLASTSHFLILKGATQLRLQWRLMLSGKWLVRFGDSEYEVTDSRLTIPFDSQKWEGKQIPWSLLYAPPDLPPLLVNSGEAMVDPSVSAEDAALLLAMPPYVGPPSMTDRRGRQQVEVCWWYRERRLIHWNESCETR